MRLYVKEAENALRASERDSDPGRTIRLARERAWEKLAPARPNPQKAACRHPDLWGQKVTTYPSQLPYPMALLQAEPRWVYTTYWAAAARLRAC